MLASAAVERAYREAAIRGIGVPLTTAEYDEGLDRLNGFLDSLFGAEIGELLTDVQVPQIQRTADSARANAPLPFPNSLTSFDQLPAQWEESTTDQVVLPINARVLWRGTTNTTIYLPQNPGDGARTSIVNTGATATLTIDGNGRLVNGANTATILSTDPNVTYFYRADLGEWKPIAELALTDDIPLPSEFNRLIICGTAIALTALDEINPSSGTMFTYERLLRRCKERYYQRYAVSGGGQNIPNSFQAYDYTVDREW
jgi:hypothetical protein